MRKFPAWLNGCVCGGQHTDDPAEVKQPVDQHPSDPPPPPALTHPTPSATTPAQLPRERTVGDNDQASGPTPSPADGQLEEGEQDGAVALRKEETWRTAKDGFMGALRIAESLADGIPIPGVQGCIGNIINFFETIEVRPYCMLSFVAVACFIWRFRIDREGERREIGYPSRARPNTVPGCVESVVRKGSGGNSERI